MLTNAFPNNKIHQKVTLAEKKDNSVRSINSSLLNCCEKIMEIKNPYLEINQTIYFFDFHYQILHTFPKLELCHVYKESEKRGKHLIKS